MRISTFSPRLPATICTDGQPAPSPSTTRNCWLFRRFPHPLAAPGQPAPSTHRRKPATVRHQARALMLHAIYRLMTESKQEGGVITSGFQRNIQHPTPKTLLTDIPYKQEDEVSPRRRKRGTQIQKRRLPHGSRLHINASVDYSAFSAFSSAAGAASSADTSSATGADSAAPAFLERRVRVAFFFVLAMFSS